MTFTRFGERQDFRDDGLELSALDVAQDLEELALRAHRRAEERELLVEEVAQVGDCVVARGRAAGDETPAGGEREDGFFPRGFSDVLEDDVDAALARELLHFGEE